MAWTVEDPPSVALEWTDEEIERCVSAANAVLADGGTDEEAVFACVRAAGRSGKGMDNPIWLTKDEDNNGGPQITAPDIAAAQAIADELQLTVVGRQLEEIPLKSLAIKGITEDTVTLGGYGILFGSELDRDLEGEYFTKDTDIWLDYYGSTKPVFYEHGFGDFGKEILGSTAKFEQDEIGWWVESELNRHKEYVDLVMALASEGILGYSSGAVGHLAERENGQIKSWPVAEMSLTIEPAEPRTLGVKELKHLGLSIGDIGPEDGDKPSAKDVVDESEAVEGNVTITVTDSGAGNKTKQSSEGSDMDEETKVQDEVKDLSPELAEAIERVYDKIGVDLTKSIGEAIGEAVKALDKAGPKPSHLVEDDLGQGKSFGDWLLAMRQGNTKRMAEVYGNGTKAAMAEGSGTTGGYAVPPEFRPELLRLAAEASIVRPRATVMPMRRRTMKIPALDVETAPTAGETQFYGGVAAAWTEEAGSLSESEPAFRDVELVAHKLAGYSLASNELLDDSAIALERLLYELFGGAVAWYEDYAFLRGNGVGKPLGIAEWCTTNISDVGVTKTAASDFRTPDVLAMFEKLLPQSYSRAVWIMHVTFIDKLYGMSTRDASGGTEADSLFVMLGGGAQDFSTALPATLLGRPILITEKLPAINNDGSVLLADLSQYLIGDREDIAIDFSEHYKFANDQATWRFLKRVDGQPWLKGAITLTDASTTLSPFVTVNY